MHKASTSELDKSLDVTRLSQTRVTQTQGDALHKQIESYTRKFEEEKRKLFRAQENQRQIMKDYQNQMSDLESLKTKKYQTEISTLNAKIKYLEINLDKGITSYNEALSKNNSLKTEIDELRKQKKNQNEAYRALLQKIEEVNSSIRQMDDDIVTKKSRVEKTKEQILQVRDMNEKQNYDHINNVDQLKKSVCFPNSIKQTMKNAGNKQTTEASDTQPIVKLRIKNLIQSNKEKMKIAEMYKKSMQKIQKSFEEIKEQSGIHDLDEITKTFLKQEEQNTFIVQYINKLTNDLEALKEQNDSLERKITAKEEELNDQRSLITGTPQEQKERTKIQNYYAEKQKPIDKLESFLTKIQPSLLQLLSVEKQPNEKILSYFNIEQYLALIEQQIDEKYCSKKPESTGTNLKDGFTKYSKAAPTLSSEDMRDRGDENILEPNKFRDYASEFWEKKKQTK